MIVRALEEIAAKLPFVTIALLHYHSKLHKASLARMATTRL